VITDVLVRRDLITRDRVAALYDLVVGGAVGLHLDAAPARGVEHVKLTPLDSVARYIFTGIVTSPNWIAPFHIDRGIRLHSHALALSRRFSPGPRASKVARGTHSFGENRRTVSPRRPKTTLVGRSSASASVRRARMPSRSLSSPA